MRPGPAGRAGVWEVGWAAWERGDLAGADEQARAALEREHQQQQERERILAADRELVTRLFLSHVQRQQQAQLSAPAVGAGVGALACATWCGCWSMSR